VLSLRTTICSVVMLCWLAAIPSYAQPASAADIGGPDRLLALDPRWTISLTSPPAAAPGFDQQLAYVPLKGGEILAIDLDRGRVAWTVPLTTTSPPATGDGMVFVAVDGALAALEQRTGATVWRTAVSETLTGPLYWDSGWVFASTDSGDVIALHAEDGRVLWRAALGSPFAVTPSAANDQVFTALRDGRLVALSLEDGALLWTLTLKEDVTGLLALEEQLLVGTRANRLHSVSLQRGRLRWSQKAGADVIGAPVVDDSNIYFVAFDNVLRALNRGNGNLRWNRNLPSRPSGGALRINDVVLVPFATNTIGAYLATTGAPSFTIQAVDEIGGAPFLRENARPTATRLVAMSRKGTLQGFAPRVEPPPAPLAELPGAKVGG
jgi:outer membrane protein assembly factor BamB